MNALHVVTESASETLELAARAGALLQAGDLVVLEGDLGAGKTVFAKGVARALGVTETVVSPTFTIVREYRGRVPLVHVDVYRLDTMQEVEDLGIEEIIGDDRVTLVEWGDVIASALPAERLVIRLELGERDDSRRITALPIGPRWAGRAGALAGAFEATARVGGV
ncbi:MAG TPA: tRNA (adenosine(37)-N6)-threonylcarbamoyltransferase complex ATPase subunit type 1 TsaE [Acidimicrobiia bacterium]|nr:tRNA (adenosine(37)-N6)-threonylcarbamoyltransferase complex ATPase subunit type 1 TsaE [Acidimicrobiia bacterium]